MFNPFFSAAAAAWIGAAVALAQPATSPVQPPKEQPEQKLADLMDVHRNRSYAPDAPDDLPGRERQRLDLYVPKTAATAADEKADAKPFPVVVWVHGGAWQAGDKYPCPVLFLVRDGFAVVSMNYRYTDSAPFPAQVEDVKAAVRWVRANAGKYNLDPKHVGAWGASAGGHLVALLGTSGGVAELEGASLGNADQDSRVQAVCDWFGPSDFASMSSGPAATELKGSLHKLFGGDMTEKRELVRQASPMAFVDKGDPPFLIMHGDEDRLVPLAHSRKLETALKEAGVKVELVVVKGAGHGFAGKEQGERARDFFVRELKGE